MNYYIVFGFVSVMLIAEYAEQIVLSIKHFKNKYL